MKYTVKEVNVTNINVEYEDGSTAVIPIVKGQDATSIQQNILAFNQELSLIHI